MLKISSPTDTAPQTSKEQTKSCQANTDASRPFIFKENQSNIIALTCPSISTSSFKTEIKFAKKTNRPTNYYLKNHKNRTNT